MSTQTALLVAGIFTVLGSLLYLRCKQAEGRAKPTERARAEAAITELRTWSTYLITLQMAAIAAMGFLFDKGGAPPAPTRGTTIEELLTKTTGVVELRITPPIAASSPPPAPSTSGASSHQAHLTQAQLLFGSLALIFFGASIVVATLLLGAFPALLMRIEPGLTEKNDFFHLTLHSFRRPQIGPMTGLQYALFLLAVPCFALFMYFRSA